ncbi:MAG: hypothetical protein ABIO02_01080 [Patescibacteria group bacterium]
MESKQYQIESEDVSTESLSQNPGSSPEFNLSSEEQKIFSSKGAIVSVDNPKPFQMSLLTTNLSLGRLTPGKISTASNTIQLYSSNGYQISVSAARPLTSLNGAILKNTQCDSGCSYLHAAPWKSSNVTGLGYSLKGSYLPEDIKDPTYYRALADLSNNERPVKIIDSLVPIEAAEHTMLFKAIPNEKDTQSYSTIITIEALPTY